MISCLQVAVLCLLVSGVRAVRCPDDCSLNGVCDTAGVCACEKPWSGNTCGVLMTAPAQLGGIYGYHPNISSWGGSLVTDAEGLHHLFAAEIPGGLLQWATHSQCIHATSHNISGPFTRKDTALAPWCHGPQVVQDPVSKQYLMVHVGTGALHPPSPPPAPPPPACLKTNTCPPAKGGPCPSAQLSGWKCYPAVCGADKDPLMHNCGADLAEPAITCASTDLEQCAASAAAECDKTAGCGAFSLASVWGLGHTKLFTQNTTRVPVDGWASWVRIDEGDGEVESRRKQGGQEVAMAGDGSSGFMHHSASLDGIVLGFRLVVQARGGAMGSGFMHHSASLDGIVLGFRLVVQARGGAMGMPRPLLG
jgi:hypothetical protein